MLGLVSTAAEADVKISSAWTAEEKLRIVICMTDRIRNDINAGRYGEIGRYNIQSVHELVAATPEVLEEYREELQALVDAYEIPPEGLTNPS